MTNTSVNPARSLAVAVFNQGESLTQLWLFWVAPIAGAVIAGLLYRFVFEKDECCGCCKDCKCEKKSEAKEEAKEEGKKAKKEAKEAE